MESGTKIRFSSVFDYTQRRETICLLCLSDVGIRIKRKTNKSTLRHFVFASPKSQNCYFVPWLLLLLAFPCSLGAPLPRAIPLSGRPFQRAALRHVRNFHFHLVRLFFIMSARFFLLLLRAPALSLGGPRRMHSTLRYQRERER